MKTALNIEVLDDARALSRRAAEIFVRAAGDAISRFGTFSVLLSGGSTPRETYRLLASDEFRESVEWTKVRFFFGDERWVPKNSEDSNYHMVSDSLFAPLGIDGSQVFAWTTDTTSPAAAALGYEEMMIGQLGRKPRFDLVLLGLGTDGHTASLFPFSGALEEDERLTTAVYIEALGAWRLTVTYPVLRSGRLIVFLVSGAEKAAALAEAINSEKSPFESPARGVVPDAGSVIWLIDRPAAAMLRPFAFESAES